MDPVERTIKGIENRVAAIQRKIHPALPELLNALKEAEAAWKSLSTSDRRPGRLKEIETQFEEELDRIQRKYSGPVQPPKGTFGVEGIYSESALTSGPEEAAVAEYVHWHRHKKSFGKDTQGMKAKDHAASRRVQRTFSDYEMLRCGQGPIKPFKGDADRWDLFAAGWGLGLEQLSPEELADFADWYCFCGGKEHNADNLKQQRLRFKKAREKQLTLNPNNVRASKRTEEHDVTESTGSEPSKSSRLHESAPNLKTN